MIQVDHLTKSFGRVRAVDDLSFVAPNGTVTGLLGPNGAGKTTTFRVIYGLLRPDSGSASIDGLDVVSQRLAAQRRLGALPDVRGLYPRLTAREHLRYFGQLHGLPVDRLEARIEDLARQIGMTEFLDRRTKGFSRGQELKVALARSLIHEPPNLILDEPTNGLDVVSSRAVRRLIGELRDAGCCIVLSSHIMAEVEAMCDRLVFIAHGRTVMEGTPDELRARTGRDDLEDMFVDAVTEGDAAALHRELGT
ncbi:MAG: ATP-binding cassette domain-containing protein [Rhodospirillaceae bacterium]|nr:ATP-binding cassette domain-containing protein [Rhodospirillaceae bacterium]